MGERTRGRAMNQQVRNRVGALVLGFVLLGLGGVHRRARGDICCNPGAEGTLTGGGVVNTYYPPATDNVRDPSSTTLALGTPTGAGTPLTFGSLLMVIQMQDAEINF